MQHTTLAVGPWALPALVSPRPGAPRLILTAPWPLTLRTFERIGPLLAPHYDLLAVDLPGFGEAEVAPECMRPSAMADVLETLVQTVAPDGAHLVATDVGVPAALSYAARPGHRLLSLTLSDGPGTGDPVLQPGLARMVESAFFRWASSVSPSLFVRLAARDGYPRSRIEPAALRDAIVAHRRPGMLRHTLAFLASYPEELPKVESGLPAIDVPTLLLWGEQDVFVPPENADRIARQIPDATVVRLAEAGHFSHDDDSEGYARALRSFVDEVEEASAPRPDLARRAQRATST